MTGLLNTARSKFWRKFLFVHSYDVRNAGGRGRRTGRPGQVGGRQAQAPKPEQMPDSEVDAGKSDSEDGAGGLKPDSGGFISKTFIISKKTSFHIQLYQKLSFHIS